MDFYEQIYEIYNSWTGLYRNQKLTYEIYYRYIGI